MILAAAAALCIAGAPIDGDTIPVTCDGVTATVRIADIDAPEIRGGCLSERNAAALAKAALDRFIGGQPVRVRDTGRQSWGRVVAHIEWRGEDVGAMMIDAGHARSWQHVNGRAVEPRPDWCLRSPMPVLRQEVKS